MYNPITDQWGIFRVSGRKTEMWCEVRTSTIPKAGKGVFTKRAFKKGAKLGVYVGKVVNFKEDASRDGDYSMEVQDGLVVVDAADCGNWTRFINDGRSKKKNNVKFTKTGTVVSLRNIEEGEELFACYGPSYWSEPDRATRKKRRRNEDH